MPKHSNSVELFSGSGPGTMAEIPDHIRTLGSMGTMSEHQLRCRRRRSSEKYYHNSWLLNGEWFDGGDGSSFNI
jgi:hypothetical protein